MKKPIRIALTGAAGSIGYSLAFRIAEGAMFGPDQPVALNLIEVEPAMKTLLGVDMELDDCAFPLLTDIVKTSSLEEGFKDVNWALLVGAAPRKKGMERSDLLKINGKIFKGQGEAIQNYAADNVKILVVGNPCNTNCLIAMNNAPKIPKDRWFAMTRLDESRAKHQLARKAGVNVSTISNMIIWGNHSPTMFPDFNNARINGVRASKIIKDENWLRNEFVPKVAQRGTEIIEKRGFSSAASAASAIIASVASLTRPSHPCDWNSVAVHSNGEYGIPEGLIASMPIRSDGKKWEVIKGLHLDEYSQEKIKLSVDELLKEKEDVKDLL